ncbi:hypothetical protein GCM10022289_33780 [Pedobacter jeongneungensis]|uniref:Cytochrome c domain-containing protein n=2 Tax=Pedobacter jeongneungensis TaxID=947309 RepID=A0ABP8BKF4_9SPHI
MVSNIIKLSLGSLLVLIFFNCKNAEKRGKNMTKISTETCNYYKYDAHQIVSNLSCYDCHLRTNERLDNNIPTFGELSAMDSLKLVDYAFTKKHKGDYSKEGAFKTSRMDTLTDCEIKSAIRYIKDYGRDIPMSSH